MCHTVCVYILSSLLTCLFTCFILITYQPFYLSQYRSVLFDVGFYLRLSVCVDIFSHVCLFTCLLIRLFLLPACLYFCLFLSSILCLVCLVCLCVSLICCFFSYCFVFCLYLCFLFFFYLFVYPFVFLSLSSSVFFFLSSVFFYFLSVYSFVFFLVFISITISSSVYFSFSPFLLPSIHLPVYLIRLPVYSPVRLPRPFTSLPRLPTTYPFVHEYLSAYACVPLPARVSPGVRV